MSEETLSKKYNTEGHAFIIIPFGEKPDAEGNKIDFSAVSENLIKPSLQANNLIGDTTEIINEAGNIREDMFLMLLNADLVICDVSIHNANVFYELGIRHALRKKGTILIKNTASQDATPFDIQTDRHVLYDLKKLDESIEKLTSAIKNTLTGNRNTDSPLYTYIDDMQEHELLTEIPDDFKGEVDRAKKTNGKGWLRLLSKEVRNRSFSWAGLRLVAQAQLEIKDYKGAKESWEHLHKKYKDDIEVNHALVNVYEGLYGKEKHIQDLKSVEFSIDRILDNDKLNLEQRTEALYLKGRSKFTSWVNEVDKYRETKACRHKAMNTLILEAYEGYYEAFSQNINHYYSGLAALQTGTIFLDLAKDEDWMDNFESDSEAENYLKRIQAEVEALNVLVPASIESRIKRNNKASLPLWVRISKADMMYLKEERKGRVIKAYENAIPDNEPFAWDLVRQRKVVFKDLEIQTALTEAIIEAMDKRFSEAELKRHIKPKQVILFAGHRIDAPDRKEPRFPESIEHEVRKRMMEKLKEISKQHCDIMAFASAAPGGDIIFHEVCEELGFKRGVLLPMPIDTYIGQNYKDMDHWRSRVLELKEKSKIDNTCTIYELSNQEGLPHWLEGAEIDPYERGTQWGLEIVQALEAQENCFVTLFDEKLEEDTSGETAKMKMLVENATTAFDIHVVDFEGINRKGKQKSK